MYVVFENTRPWIVVQKARRPHKENSGDEGRLNKSGPTTRLNRDSSVTNAMNTKEQIKGLQFISLNEEDVEIIIENQDNTSKENNE